jgi:hypothetical protein
MADDNKVVNPEMPGVGTLPPQDVDEGEGQ